MVGRAFVGRCGCAIAAAMLTLTCVGCTEEMMWGAAGSEGPAHDRRGYQREFWSTTCVVYVIDRSASMEGTFGRVREEVLSAIEDLGPRQPFDVILCADGEPLERSAGGLTPASAHTRQVTAEFLNSVEAGGRTYAVPAIRRAFEVLRKAPPRQPKLIFIIGDGFVDNHRLLDAIEELWAFDVYINTFVVGDDAEAHKVMQRIAENSGGVYRHMTEWE